MSAVDPVTLEVVRNGLAATAEEMNATLVRTGYSPNIKERRDCSTAIFDADGRMVSQAETMPVHLGAMPFSVAAAVEAYPPETLASGDAILLNDPFRGGAHLPDLTLVSPVFRDGDVVAYVANRAHHADIGGSHAGSVAADSTEIYQEGLRIPPVQIAQGGDLDEDLLSVILANVRTPTERRGDLRAQLAANETGRHRAAELFDRYGIDTVLDVLSAVMEYSEQRMRQSIADLPDGETSFEDVLDDDGRGNTNLPVVATITVDGSDLTVDFDGTAAQTDGPINAVYAVTASATYYAVRTVTDPDIPPNHGCYRPVTIRTPSRSLVDPDPPAAVVGGNLETSQRITDVVLGALAEFAPEAVPAAGQGTMNNVTFGGTDPRDDGAYAFYETQGGGAGGRARGDGLDAVHVHMSNTLNTPIEVLETAYPLRVERYALRTNSAGAGEHRGGHGLRRDIRIRDHDATVSLLAERHRSAPYGLNGGSSGMPGTAILNPDGDAEPLPAKVTRQLPAGSLVSIRTPGGGGYGDPHSRSEDAIAVDLRAGLLSPDRVRAVYDVDPVEIDGQTD
jgi:N-methylhydantoinase B